MGTLVIERGRAEPLTFYPSSVELYSPSAGDIRVGTPSTAMPAEGSETACTVDTVATTTNGAVSRGVTSLVVASATGITAGRRYLIVTARERFSVTVRSVASTTVHLDEPLPADVATGSTFSGLAVMHTLTTGETSDLGVGHVILRMTVNGIVRRSDYELRVEPRVFPLLLSLDEMLVHNEVRRLRSPTDLTLEDTRRAAWEMELKPRLNARGIVEHRITSPSVVNRPLMECVVLRLMRSSGAGIESITDQELRVNRVIGDMLASQDYWYQADVSTTGRTDERQHITEHEYVRLSR